jgi:hypothetical protein
LGYQKKEKTVKIQKGTIRLFIHGWRILATHVEKPYSGKSEESPQGRNERGAKFFEEKMSAALEDIEGKLVGDTNHFLIRLESKLDGILLEGGRSIRCCEEARLTNSSPSEEVKLILREGIVNKWPRGAIQSKRLTFYLTGIVLFDCFCFQHLS